MDKTFSIISLGCFRNTYDSEVVIGRFMNQGYKFKKEFDKVDLLIVNTCGFISDAKEESFKAIGDVVKLKKQKKVKKIIIMGCLVKRYKDDLKENFPKVDLWAELEDFPQAPIRQSRIIPDHIEFLKIAEGCSHCCSYCAIPLIKGGLKSRPAKAILEEISSWEGRAVRELNIIGQDITSWGQDLNPKRDLVYLLNRIIKKNQGIDWIRLLYTHPDLFSDELIRFIADHPRMCNYIDLPIQHINDRILKLMNRKTSKRGIIRLIEKIRKRIPGVVLRTSLIVGFPGETEKEFKELLNFVKDTKFEKLGVFAYSREENTPAYGLMPQVHNSTRKRRAGQIMEVQQKISTKINRNFVGKRLDVLVDEEESNCLIGRTQYNCYDVDGVVYIKNKDFEVGKIYNLRITDSYEYDLVAV
jgi:ribosomal protein S12 methylthiotransferase